MATSASKAEATSTNINFSFEGKDYEVVPTSEWDLDILEAMEDGKIVAILRQVLVGDGYSRFHATKPNVGKISEFFEALQQGLGTAGN